MSGPLDRDAIRAHHDRWLELAAGPLGKDVGLFEEATDACIMDVALLLAEVERLLRENVALQKDVLARMAAPSPWKHAPTETIEGVTWERAFIEELRRNRECNAEVERLRKVVNDQNDRIYRLDQIIEPSR